MSLLTNSPRDIERFIQDRRGAPVRLYECESTALPDPVKWRGGLISLTDLECPAYSNGTSWFPFTLGAAL